GLEFLFKPDFSKVTMHTFYEAMSMAFFSLSLGTACLVTYASYFRKDSNIGKFALQISIIDVVVAILAGITIFPAAFSVGVEPDAGPSLIFLTIPNVFTQAFSPTAGYYLSILFYFLLVLAALTSTISMHEIGTSLLSQEMKTSRTVAGTLVTIFCCIMGTLCALSFSHPNIGVMGSTLFDNLDSVTSKVFMPIGAFATCMLVGWVMSRKTVMRQLTSNNRYAWSHPTLRTFFFLVKFVCPILIGIIFVVNIFFTN
ncbi:MAG: sodium-dependent transporter, partial [Prevotella sp.]|nr:sodium-dependent transporter [Prevotella sp.]